MTQTIGIIGAGAWGTALAQVQAHSGKNVVIWAREPEVVASINNEHENTLFLNGVQLHKNIRATGDYADVVNAADIILLVTPAQHLRATLKNMGDLNGKQLVLCAKGIEIETGELLTNIVRDTVGLEAAVLTGPTFAAEIARLMPASITIAARNITEARALGEILGSKTFRPYASDDRVGAELGGAVKNVLAIACGIAQGKNYGDSGRAALLTRGMAEMTRLNVKMGGKRETLMGMCGLGDLVLTANSMQSRNFSFGVALGQGKTVNEILSSRNSVTEGVHTARAIAKLAEKLEIELPIIQGVDAIIHAGKSTDDAISAILSRPFGDEN